MAIFRGIGGAGDSTTDATITAVTEQATNAANSATAAASSASSASTSASNASTSETNAAASASAAATSETNASTSETNAAASASSAATSAAEAAVSAASINPDSIDINGGTIDNTIIGATQPSQGYFSGGTIDNTIIGATQPSHGYFISSSLSQDLTFTGNSRGIHFNSVPDAELYLNSANGYVTLNLLTNSPGFDIAAAGFPKFTFTKATGDLTATSFTGNLTGNVKVESALTDLLIESDGSFGSFIGFNYNAATSSVIYNSLFTQSIEFPGSNGRINFKTSSTLGASPVLRQSIKAGGQIEFYEDTGTTPKVTWVATTETLNFADNVKAVFGDGSDLEIYSDGTNGYISGSVIFDGGTIDGTVIGGTTAAAGTFTNLTSTGTSTHATVDINGGTIDGTTIGGTTAAAGTFTTLTSTGLTVDTDTLYVDSANNRVGIGTTSPGSNAIGSKLEVSSAGTTGITVTSGTISDGFINFSDGGATTSGQLLYDHFSNYMRMYVNGAERLRITSSGNVGIGTSSPASSLEVNSGTTNRVASFISTDATALIEFADSSTTNRPSVGAVANNLILQTNGEKVRIDSSGNVGIGTTSPNKNGFSTDYSVTTLQGTLGGAIEFTDGTSNNVIWSQSDNLTFDADKGNVSGSSYMRFRVDGSEAMRITSAGDVAIGSTTADEKLHIVGTASTRVKITSGGTGDAAALFENASGNTWAQGLDVSSGNYAIAYAASGTPSLTSNGLVNIDSSGNVLVGKTSLGAVGAGSGFGAGGVNYMTADGAATLRLNRETSDGDIVQFRKDNTTVGSIGVKSSIPYFIRTTGGVIIGNTALSACDGNGDPADNVSDLGALSVRWDDVYATNGTIQTSDRNEKQDIEALSEAEARVAVAAKGLLRKFRWRDAVTEKGDDARIHFGIIAQDLQDAFAAEGLDAGRYAMFISSTWWEATETYTDDDGVEQTRTNTYETQEEAPQGATQRTRLGVRYPELLAFIIAAI